MWSKILPPIIIAIAERLLEWLRDYLKQKELEKKIKNKAKDNINAVRKIKDRKERAKRLNDIINS